VGGACGRNGGEAERVHVIGKKIRRKETTRKTRRRWVDNIKMGLVEI
jgi:hypothetical protein